MVNVEKPCSDGSGQGFLFFGARDGAGCPVFLNTLYEYHSDRVTKLDRNALRQSRKFVPSTIRCTHQIVEQIIQILNHAILSNSCLSLANARAVAMLYLLRVRLIMNKVSNGRYLFARYSKSPIIFARKFYYLSNNNNTEAVYET